MSLVEKLQKFSPDDAKDEEQVAIAVSSAEALVEAYCRGRHVDPAGVYRPGVEAVIIAVASRLLGNPSQIQRRDQAGPFATSRGEGFSGFTLVELAVLNRYRKRAL